MVQPKPTKQQRDKIQVEAGTDKCLAHILKKALNTPPRRQPANTAPSRKPKK